MDDKTITAALTGPITMVMKMGGRNMSILHGEVFGLTWVTFLWSPNQDNQLYTDHLNSVRFLQNAHTSVDQEKGLRYRNGRSYLRWLLRNSEETRVQVSYEGPLEQQNARVKAGRTETHLFNANYSDTNFFTMNDFTAHTIEIRTNG